MSTRMLIDARHPEETRVAVLKGNRVEEFDFESAEHKQIKGNIYLAKVTRVEPSLQAAFVDFGGNRHGFLAFSEIHPDYYQIPKEDRDALLAEEAEHAEKEAELRAADEADEDEEDSEAEADEELSEDEDSADADDGDGETDDESSDALAEDLAEAGAGEEPEEIDTSEKEDVTIIEEGQLEESTLAAADEAEEEEAERGPRHRSSRRGRRRGRGGGARAKQADEIRAKRMALRRRYKIQDVIHRRQVLLVQVVKEERGNKGAALTSYLSLAGRYCVLMPNSSHGGGISRKISNAGDRKRLKQIVADLKLPRSMGLIVRTAGLKRTKTEIKRDFDYLARLWDEIREKTLSSSAPTLIHSDSDLIKRAIRDIYNREIQEVIVEGEEGYRSAKQFMKLLMPSHARRVKAYSDPVPLFQRYGAEDQLRAMYDPVVQLKSGGYLVINPTEALVSIDINSGRSTKEHGIEATALNTNLEAAREIARQLRLRDMAGLVVIDFIDMEHNSNTRKVERAMKEALKNDRARIQVGRISGFGLMEMSRQRLRTGVLEATTRECPHCDGSGLVRTASSASLSALRLVEDEAAKGKGTHITLSASTEAAVYLLNSKRADLQEIEQRYGVSVEVVPEGEDEGAKMSVASSGPKPAQRPEFAPIIDDDDDDEEDSVDARADNDDGSDEPRKKRRRRRGGRGRKRQDGASEGRDGDRDGDADGESDREQSDRAANDDSEGSDDGERKSGKSRRGRRGGRKRRRGGDEVNGEAESGQSAANDENGGADAETPKSERRTRAKTRKDSAEDSSASAGDDTGEDGEAAKPKRSRSRKAPGSEAERADKRRSRKQQSDETGEQADGESREDAPKRAKRSPRKAKADDAGESMGKEKADQDEKSDKPKPRAKSDKAKSGSARSSRAKPAAAKSEKGKSSAAKASKAKSEKAQSADADQGGSSARSEPAKAASAPTKASSAAEAPQASSSADAASSGDGGSERAMAGGDADQSAPRRGWWQRTFGG